jgi:hypothetical protein
MRSAIKGYLEIPLCFRKITWNTNLQALLLLSPSFLFTFVSQIELLMQFDELQSTKYYSLRE